MQSKLDIGGTIRRLRRQQHRTQQEIATRCGFTKSLLSKIEANKTIPPVATLVKIASALGVSMSVLIETDICAETVFTTEADVEKNLVKTDRGYWIYPFATQHKKKRMQPFLFVARKGEVRKHHVSHEGEEFIYVVEGDMKFQVGQAEYRLSAGCSLYFNAAHEHQVIPVTKTVKYIDVFV
jgi:transcriptional regulator with XRE-family HTH domain